MSHAEELLRVESLVKTFRSKGLGRRSVSAVDDVSFSLARGESIGIVGESGCGKSTLARMIVGLEKPTSGEVRIDGTDVGRARGRERRELSRRVQMVFQDPYTSLNPRLTIFDVVSEPLRVHRLETRRARLRERVGELLEQVNLPAEMMNRHPHQFSGGQRQRIGIARALALEPEILVCDEPVSALDVSVQAQVINMLRELQRSTGIAVVFIAHDLSVVRHVSDRTMVMYLGRLAEVGPTPELFTAPGHPYTNALLSASPVVDPDERAQRPQRIVLRGDPPSPTDPPSGCRFRTRCQFATDECAVDQPRFEPVAGSTPDHLAACLHLDQQRQATELASGGLRA